MATTTTGRVLTGLAVAAGAVAAGRALGRRLSGRRLDLAGKVVVVTGGSRGLGFVLAGEYLRRGARVAICARNRTRLAAARDELVARSDGDRVLAAPADVSRPDQVRIFVDRVLARWGRIDVLVNSAAVLQVGPFAAMGRREFEETMAVDFWGPYNTIEAVLPHFREQGGGRIVNVASLAGRVPLPHLLPYSCAKFALVGLSHGLRSELAGSGIDVVTVVLGLVRTGAQLNLPYRGRPKAEYAWFSLAAATPATGMSARRAARLVADATRRGDAELVVTWQARLLVRAAALAPGRVTDLMGWVNRLLPDAGEGRVAWGSDLADQLRVSPATFLVNHTVKRLQRLADDPAETDDAAS